MKPSVHIQDKPVRLFEMSMDEIKGLAARLIDVARLIGIQEPPKDIAAVVSFIRKYYSSLTITEVSEAFLMNAAGKLLERHVPYYSSFDITFVGSVLQTYVETMRQRKLERPAVPAEPLPLLENDVPRDVQQMRMTLALCKVVRDTGRVPITWPWGEVYAVLSRKGRVKWSSDTEKQAFIQRVKARMESEAKAKLSRGWVEFKNAISEASDSTNIDYQLKREWVIQYFKKYER